MADADIADGASSEEELLSEVQQDPRLAIKERRQHLDVGAYKLMVEPRGSLRTSATGVQTSSTRS